MKKNATRPTPTMTENERARAQGFKNFLEKKQAQENNESKNKSNDSKNTGRLGDVNKI